MGRGGTGLLFSKGLDRLFYNPALLYNKDPQGNEHQLLSPQLSFSSALYELVKDYDTHKNMNNTEVIDFIGDRNHEHLYLHAQSTSGMTFDSFSFAFATQANLNLQFDFINRTFIPDTPIADIISLDDALEGVFLFGTSRNFFQYLTIGLTGKVNYKYVFEDDLPTTSVLQFISDLQNETESSDLNRFYTKTKGYSFGLDIGMTYAFPVFLKPTLAIVAQDIFCTNYFGSGKRPKKESTYFHMGLGLSHNFFDIIDLRFSTEVSDVTNQSKSDFLRRLQIGLQSEFYNIFGLSAGIYQGYPSYGIYAGYKFLKPNLSPIQRKQEAI